MRIQPVQSLSQRKDRYLVIDATRLIEVIVRMNGSSLLIAETLNPQRAFSVLLYRVSS